jgi:uncharacterized protein YdhG (YjbR/CyaY superfamily)
VTKPSDEATGRVTIGRFRRSHGGIDALACGISRRTSEKRRPEMTETKKSAKSTKLFSDDEREAMKERAKEQKAEARRGKDEAAGEADVLEKIAEMPGPDRAMAERIHAVVKASAPSLAARTWYGMPAYTKDGKVVCFFKAADKFKSRYATFGFEETANLDEGSMWPTSWALTKLTDADEKRIGELVKKAVR